MTLSARKRWQWQSMAGSEPGGCQWVRLPLAFGEECNYAVMLEFPKPPGPVARINFSAEDRHRIECHVLIGRLHARGLGEAVGALRDMVEFYVEDLAPALPPPPVRSVQARIGVGYISTVPPFAEE